MLSCLDLRCAREIVSAGSDADVRISFSQSEGNERSGITCALLCISRYCCGNADDDVVVVGGGGKMERRIRFMMILFSLSLEVKGAKLHTLLHCNL